MPVILVGLLVLLFGGAAVHADVTPTDSTPHQLLEQARVFEQARRYREALEHYRRYLEARPENDEVRATVAKLMAWQEQWDEAVTTYRDVLSRHPFDHDSRVGLARVLAWQKRFDDARREFEWVLREDPRHADALAGLGDVFLWSGHPEEAIPYYRRVLAVTGDPEVAARLRTLETASPYSGTSPDAGPAGSKTASPLTGPPNSVEGILEEGHRLEADSRFAEATALYREGLRQQPDNDDLRGALARVLSWGSEQAEATELYRQILTRRPNDRETRVALARVLSWRKLFAEARREYAEVLRTDSSDLQARRGLAEVAHWEGRRAEAIERYEALVAETHDPEMARQLDRVRSELLVSPRAAVGQGLTGLRLPYRDYAKLGYGHYTYTHNQPDERDVLVEMAKPLGNQTLVMRVEPIHRFGFHDTPVSAELYSPLWSRAWGYVAAQGTVNPHFAPNYSLVGEVAQGLGGLHSRLAPLEVSFGYRRLNYKHDDIDLLMPGLTMFLPFNVWLTEKVYYVPHTGAITLSSQLTWRPTDRVQLFASGSFGTSGERIVATQDFTRVGSRTLQGGAIVPVNSRFSAEASGYYEDRGVLYVRRGGNLSLIYHW